MLTDGHESIPDVKWLLAFRNRNVDGTGGIVSIREFRCGGYYEAFERVMCYADKTGAEILWFKEKRECNEPLNFSTQLPLGCFCTYCNTEHNTQETVPCKVPNCNAAFCSRECYGLHMKLKHAKSG